MTDTVSPESVRAGDTAVERPRRVPLSTYRLQLSAAFTFADARAILPYLDRLGISDCYTSPYFAAQPGSTHGYDVGDYNALNPELGGEAEFDRFVAAVAGRGMGHVLDFVPNHMTIDPRSNPSWRDVLENGPCSPSARFFDIDWSPVKDELVDKLLLPILGDQYGKVLERGELRLSFEDAQLVLDYTDYRLPINPRQAPRVYRHGIEALQRELGEEDAHLLEFLSILTALESMPAYTASDPASIAARRREKEIARRRLAVLVEARPRIRAHIEEAVRVFNGEPGRPETFDRLHDLLEAQAYRLAYWRTAVHEINYRRFFDINHLVGVRVEDPEAFEATHRLLFRLMREGKVWSIRVDHPDGLLDPARYFADLQALAARAWDAGTGAGARWRPAYVVVEKILSATESLPESWAVYGTVGYDFLNNVNGLFVQPTSAKRLRRLCGRLTGRDAPFADVAYDSKQIIMETGLASELNVLARELNRISESDRRSRDFTLNSLRDALLEVVASFPVYRTYVTDAGWTSRDRGVVATAIARARGRNPALESSVFDFVLDVLLPRGASRDEGHAPPYDPDTARRLRFSMKFQQYTAPVQAKGVEDTAFYRHNVLLSLNEVGGDPLRFGCDPEAFHAANAERAAHRPFEMVTTATHDAKLGEDARARLNVLSELAEEWSREVSRWMHLTRGACRVIDGGLAPDRNDRYRFFQVLVGIWPPEMPAVAARPELLDRVRRYLTKAVRFLRARAGTAGPKRAGAAAAPELVDRLRRYMIKAIREAKLHTSWVNPHEAYEAATAAFVEQVLAGPAAARFLPAFLPFQQRVARLGMVNSLAQTLLKLTAPGVPDFYQGTELWDLTLVDPDNRRPVDFAQRQALLAALEPLLPPLDAAAGTPQIDRQEAVAHLLEDWPDGRIKMFVTACGLRLRRRLPELFLAGEYVPLEADVTAPAGVVAFARMLGPHALVTLVPRLFAGLIRPDRPLPVGGDCWNISHVVLPARLATREFRNVLTGEVVEPAHTHGQAWLFVGQVLKTCPVAILEAVA